MIVYRSSAVLTIWCKFSPHVPCSCSLEFHFDLINLSRHVLLSPSLKHSCFSTLRCYVWAYGCILIAVLHVQVGVNFRKNGVWPSLYDVVRSWLRLQTPIDCIPHPYCMYTKCLSNLRWCGWAYGCTLMPYHMCAGGVNFRKIGVWPSLYDVAVSWLRLQTPIDCIPHL